MKSEENGKISPIFVGFFLACLAVLNGPSIAVAQRVSSIERQNIRQIKNQIDQANRHLRGNRIAESVAAYQNANRELTSLAGGAREELAKQLLPEYQRLEKLFNGLKDQTDSLPELLSWEEMIESQPETISFQKDVAPIIVAKCGNCHVDRNRGNFSAASFDALDKSTAIAYGLPNDSRLIEVIVNGEMPQGGLQVEPQELETLMSWIRQGAKFDGADPNENLRRLIQASDTAEPSSPEIAMASGNETVSFSLQIAPILIENCSQCHMVNNPRGNFNQASITNLLRGGDGGAVIVPGSPQESRMFRRIEAGEMPPSGKLPQDAINLIKTWIEEGAKFDHADPNLPLVTMAAMAKANVQTHAELLADRQTLATSQWKLVMGQVEPVQVESQDFRILGTSDLARLESLAKSLEEERNKLFSALKSDSSQPLVKGNFSIFVFDKRYDFTEFSRMVEGREVPRELSSTWNYSVTDAYIAILLTQNQSASDVQVTLTQKLAALHVAALSADVPRWFSDGVGYWVASRLHPRSDQVKDWEEKSWAAIRNISSSEEVINSKIELHQAGLVGYQWVKSLKRKSASFDKLIQSLGAGDGFEKSFRSAYGLSPREMF